MHNIYTILQAAFTFGCSSDSLILLIHYSVELSKFISNTNQCEKNYIYNNKRYVACSTVLQCLQYRLNEKKGAKVAAATTTKFALR